MARKKSKGNTGRFAGLPHYLMGTGNYIELSVYSKALLYELAYQYNGKNNGDLTLTASLLGERGFASSTVSRCLNELKERGFVVVTRQGWKQRGKPTLLAITWQGIDDHPSGLKYDEGVKVDPRPLSLWRNEAKKIQIKPEKVACKNAS